MQQAEQKVKKCFSEEAAAAGIGAYYVCPASCTESCGSMCTNKKQMAQACHLPYVFSL